MSTRVFYPKSFSHESLPQESLMAESPIPGPSWNWVTLSGPDAQDFLHRLTTVDVRNLEPNAGKAGCFLTAQGKIRASFQLWNLGQTGLDFHYAFEFDGGSGQKWKQNLLSVIDQYTFGEKIKLVDHTSSTERLACIWVFPDSLSFIQDLKDNTCKGQTDPHLQICNHGSLNYNRNWLTIWGMQESLDFWITQNLSKMPQWNKNPLTLEELESWRIQAVQPKVDAEITELSIPLEIGLNHSIAENKGCYPGQEVIEKIISLGSPARRLVRIQARGGNFEVGQKIQAIDPSTRQITQTVIGSVTSVSPMSGSSEFQLLALIRKTHVQIGLRVGFESMTDSTEKDSCIGEILQIAAAADGAE